MYNELWKEFEKSGDIQAYLKYRGALEPDTNTNPNICADTSDSAQTEPKTNI